MKFKMKGFTSLLLACCFTVASISGIVLYLTPKGRVANWTNWTMAGLDKHGWGAVHMNSCLLVLLVAGLHLLLNWKVFLSYIKRRTTGLNLKVEMATALLITAAVVGGTVMQVPPFTATTALNEAIKSHWEKQAPGGPAPHAEDFSVTRLASSIGLTLDEVTSALEEEGIVVEDPEISIGELAKQKDLAPSDLYAAIRKQHPDSAGDMPVGPGRGGGMGMGMGMGRGMGRGMGAGQGQGRRGSWHQSDGDQSGVGEGRDTEEGHGLGGPRQPGPDGGTGRGRGPGGRGPAGEQHEESP